MDVQKKFDDNKRDIGSTPIFPRGIVIKPLMNRILIITLIAATLIAIPENVGSVQTGPFVDVTVSNSKLEVGKETTVTVFVYELEGEDQVPKDLIEVTMTASMGSFESDTGITNHNGYCTFTYHAPDDIDGPTDVQINATAEIGALNYIGRAEILVSYKLVGRIEGPSMLKRGSPVTTYIVNVTANGEPMENVNIMPTVFGKGSMDSYSRHTGPDGKGSLSIIPSDDSTGKITIMIQLGLMDYLGVSVSRFIQVVEELSPLNVTVSADHNPLRWGSCHLTARVSRGDYPESGVTILWEVSSGYVLRERTKTNESGESRVILTTLPEEGMNWPDHIVVNVTASQLETVSYAEENIPIEEEELSIDILHNSEFKYRVKHSQLYPGEDLVLDLNLFHREYQYHDWEWVWGMKLDLTLYYGEEVIFQSTLESDLHTIEETIVEVDRRAVWTVPDDITDGNYTWSLLLTDRDSNHAYWSYQADKPLLLRRQGRDDWTIMYFFAGRNNLAPWFDRSLKDLKKKAPDGEYKVLCNYDRSNGYDDPYYVKWDGTKYFDLEEGYSKEDTMFGPNSGDPDNLVRFMEWATAISTTGRYCLVYCDHGAAHRGIGVDEYWNDHLTIGEFENGLESFSGIRRDLEVLVMDACHMASLEVANYLSDYTGYQVFSQLTIYSDHSFDNERALKNLNQYDWESSKPSPLQVATAYLNSFIQVAGGTEYDSPAMVLDSEKGYQLAHLFNEAMRSLYLGWDTLGECFDAVFEEAQRLEGPYSDQWNLTDMKNMLILLREELSDYVLDPAGRSAFNKVGEVISYFDSVRAYYHPMGDLNGLNVFLPDHMEPAESPFREGLSLIGHHDHDYWLKVLDVLWHGNYHREEMLDPLQVVEYNVIEEEGEPSIVQVNLTLGEQRPETVFIRATQWSSMGSMGNLSAMSVIEGDDLDRDSLQVILRVPETDLYSLSVTALDENGDVITNKHLGHRRINGSDTDPPKIELESSSTEIEAGEMITFNCTTEEGGNIYWDLDSRDGIYIEGTGASIERGYRKPGNLTVTCMVNSEDGVTVDHIDIRVLPPENNSDPMPVLTYRSTGGLNYTLNGSESLDPDGDPVQYRFNFGDGNWTGWMDECSLTHRFGGEGTYNCSLKVRDSKGGVSDRTFILLEALESPEDNGSINEPPVAVYEEKITFHIDEKLVLDLTDSYDPEGEKLSVLVQWGDGKITDWTTDLSLEHSYDYTGKYIIKFEITDESNNSVRGEIEVIAREPYDTPPPPSPDYSWQVPLAFLFAVLMSVLIVISIAVLIIAKRQGENLEE